MDSKKICFIICTNNEQYLNEAVYYINRLNIPEGYSIDLLTVAEALSMTSGYNEAMNASDAKYKIYMHQDVMIIEPDFLYHILDIFKEPDIGMLGIIGYPEITENCIIWEGESVGKLYSNSIYDTLTRASDDTSKYTDVKAIDGLLMATQYDIPWREDLFKKWDFYDVSQSFEFRNAGYRIVVPNPAKPWCIHDDGLLNLKNYYEARRIFKKEYIK